MLGRDFGTALNVLKAGGRVCRKGWNGKNMYIKLQEPERSSKMGKPYLYIRCVDGTRVPWTPSQTDLLENDWVQYVEPENTGDCCVGAPVRR